VTGPPRAPPLVDMAPTIIHPDVGALPSVPRNRPPCRRQLTPTRRLHTSRKLTRKSGGPRVRIRTWPWSKTRTRLLATARPTQLDTDLCRSTCRRVGEEVINMIETIPSAVGTRLPLAQPHRVLLGPDPHDLLRPRSPADGRGGSAHRPGAQRVGRAGSPPENPAPCRSARVRTSEKPNPKSVRKHRLRCSYPCQGPSGALITTKSQQTKSQQRKEP
jgi:hypothetical protein